MNQNLFKGLLLIAIAIFFGVQAVGYPMGTLGRAGPGLFPTIVSGLLLLLGAIIVLRSFLIERLPVQFSLRNIALVTASLVVFAVVSDLLNMLVALVALVFLASLASEEFSLVRVAKICVFLGLVAFGLEKGLGFQLKLF